MTDFKPAAELTQYYDITGWSAADVNAARKAGHLADLMSGKPAPTENKENNE